MLSDGLEFSIPRPSLRFKNCTLVSSVSGQLMPYDEVTADALFLINNGSVILRENRQQEMPVWEQKNHVCETYAPYTTVEQRIAGTDKVLVSGDVFWIKAGSEYMLYSSMESSYYVISYTGELDFQLPQKCTLSDSVRVLQSIRQMQYYAGSSAYSPALCDYTLILLFCEIYTQAAQRDSGTSELYRRICNWIHENAFRHITVADIAKQFQYNPDYLSRLFQQESAARSERPRGLQRHIIDERLNCIKHMLLTTDLPLKEVATRLDFPDYKLFLKYFTYHTSLTPSQFRKIFSDAETPLA